MKQNKPKVNDPIIRGDNQFKEPLGITDIEPSKKQTSGYHKVAAEIADLVVKKQAAYGESFNNAFYILDVLYPNGIKNSQYQDMLAVIRIIDKLFRISHKKDALGESPYRDIAGYGLLGAVYDGG